MRSRQRQTSPLRQLAPSQPLFHREQLNQRYAQPRPVQFYQGPLRRLAPQLTAARTSASASEIASQSPNATGTVRVLRSADNLHALIPDVGQQRHRAAAHLNLPQPQDQGRLTLSGHLIRASSRPGRRVHAHNPTSRSSASRWHRRGSKAVPGVLDGFPQVVADEARIGTKQRVGRELLLGEQLPEVVALIGIRGAIFPTPRQTQAHVPQQGRPDLRLDRLGGTLATTPFPLLLAIFGSPAVAVARPFKRLARWRVRGVLMREPSTARASQRPTRQCFCPHCSRQCWQRCQSKGSNWLVQVTRAPVRP